MGEIDFLVGETVVELRDENRIVFQVGRNPEPRLYADVGEHALKRNGSEAPLSSLVGQTVTAASAMDRVLTLAFGDGASLRCEPHPDYEAWQVVGGEPEYLVVCLPGDGELAIWDSSTPPISLDEANELFAKWTQTDQRGSADV